MRDILQGRMAELIDRHLDKMEERDQADRRYGGYLRHLLTELGDIELVVPRTRTFSAGAISHAYARRVEKVDRKELYRDWRPVAGKHAGGRSFPFASRLTPEMCGIK